MKREKNIWFWLPKGLASMVAVTSILAIATPVSAGVKHEGDWPKDERRVSMDWEGDRALAVRELAKSAQWNLVVGEIKERGNVSVHVKGVPADVVLDAIFATSTANYEAKRTGDLVVLRELPGDGKDAAESKPSDKTLSLDGKSVGRAGIETKASTDSAATSEPKTTMGAKQDAGAADTRIGANDGDVTISLRNGHGDGADEETSDRVAKGESIRVEKGETVHDVSVFGGSVDVFGNVTGDLVVVGGSAHVHEGAHVSGDAFAIGGKLEIEKGARVDGDTGVIGGVFAREAGALLRGKTYRGDGEQKLSGLDLHVDSKPEKPLTFAQRAANGFGHVTSLFAFLFVFGSVLLALQGTRMEALRVEAGLRPMRNFAVGLVGFFAFVAGLVILCVTIIGIPLALFGAVIFAFALYAGIVAVSGLVGELLLRHRTQNAYAHLALGAALFVLLTQLPKVGTLVGIFVGLLGMGTILATRAARSPGAAAPGPTPGPYRTM